MILHARHNKAVKGILFFSIIISCLIFDNFFNKCGNYRQLFEELPETKTLSIIGPSLITVTE